MLSTVDPELATLVAAELDRHDVRVRIATTITAITRTSNGLHVTGHDTNDPTQAFAATADVVLIIVGVRPDTTLAQTAGVALGVRGALAVDRRMRTNIPNIFAAGDCAHTYHRVLDTDAYLPLGTTAHKQGRVAGANAVGADQVFAGVVGTQVVKVFDLVAARTGLREHQAIGHGL